MNKTQAYMTKRPVTVNADETMRNAWALMQEKGFRHLPVIDARGAVIGILSDRDIQRAMTVTRRNQIEQEITLAPDLLVRDYMSWPVYVVNESTSIRKVVEEMLTQKVSAFLVEDNIGRVKGIITTDDILKVFLDKTEEEQAMKNISYYFTLPEAY